MADRITISREVYDFLMGDGPLEGVWFNEFHKSLPGRFWWRGVLRSAAGWPEPAQADRNPEGHDPAEGHGRNDESPVAAASGGDAPKVSGHSTPSPSLEG